MSSSPHYIYCDKFDKQKITKKKNVLELISNDPSPFNNNFTSKLSEFEPILINYKSSLGYDLIKIATYIYIADCQIKRGTYKEAYETSWQRNLNFYIPVIEPDIWSSTDINKALSETLEFLTGDKFTFQFCKGDPMPIQQKLDFNELDHKLLDRKCVSMFSGGVDSLYAAIKLLEEEKHPIFISHRSTSKLTSFRDELNKKLTEEYNLDFQKIEVGINNCNNNVVEDSQRSRSFLYASLGSAFASCFNISEVYLSDNGPISLNLPYTNQNTGTLNSRSTNPKFLALFNILLTKIWKTKAPKVQNKLLWQTRGETIKDLKDMNKSYLLSYTTTCAHTRNITNMQPYCGICSQCIDRRFAVEWANISNDDDPREHYAKDIFFDNLKDGIEKTHAENFYRRANTIVNKNNIDHFLNSYPDLYSYGQAENDFEEFIKNTHELYKRHSSQILEVIRNRIELTWDKFRDKTLNPNSLMAIIYREADMEEEITEKTIEKALIINKESREIVLHGIKIGLTKYEFEFIEKLALKPNQWIKYKELTEDELNVSDIAKERKNKIRKKLELNFKENRKEISLVKDLFGNKKLFGYKLNLNKEQIEII